MISFIGKKSSPQLNRPLIDLTEDHSILMNERSRTHSWEGLGPVSLKTALQGEADYEVMNKKFRIDKDRFMMLNDFQKYRITVDCPYETETFIIFFNRGLMHSVANSIRKNHEQLLADGANDLSSEIRFHPGTQPFTSALKNDINIIKQMMALPVDPQLIQEKLFILFDVLLGTSLNTPSSEHDVKLSTRTEIRRRNSIAIDYLHAQYHTSVTLDELSEECYLSKNHFLRTFKQEYGKTPFQYLAALRVEKAKDLLTHSNLPVTHICSLTGFESLSYFSWMFRNQTGFSPTEFRNLE